MKLLNDKDPEVARKAIYALGQLQNADALNALVAALGHLDAEGRNTLSNAVAAFGQSDSAALLKVLNTSSTAARIHAADILGLIGDSSTAGALAEALQDEVWDVQFIALSALRNLPGEEARQAISATIRDSGPLLNVWLRQCHPVDSYSGVAPA